MGGVRGLGWVFTLFKKLFIFSFLWVDWRMYIQYCVIELFPAGVVGLIFIITPLMKVFRLLGRLALSRD